MNTSKPNKVFRHSTVAPQPNSTLCPNKYAPHVNDDQSRYAESVPKPAACNRLITCMCGILIGMLIAVGVTVPLMMNFYGAKNNDESTTIVSTTNANPTTIINTTLNSSGTTSNSTTQTTSISGITSSSTTPTTTSISNSFTSTTITTTNIAAFLLYGVQLNLDPTSLSSNWSQCYSGTYNIPMNSSLLTYILSTCYKGKLMSGCRAVGNSSLTVAATGLRADVLYNCSTISNCSNVANGVGWYYSDTWSWGFVNNTDPVIRNSCDTGITNPNHRICWHTGQTSGGYRCGSTLGLNSVTTYERVIYHAN